MNSEQFLTSTIRPVLEDMGMYSKSAEKLLLMTACHESGGFQHRVQIGAPAKSYFQIEPATLDDLYENYLSYRPERQELVDSYLPDDMAREEALEESDDYACAVARMIYARVPEALPMEDDTEAMADYCKQYWNTELGKATPEKYLTDYIRYKPVGYD